MKILYFAECLLVFYARYFPIRKGKLRIVNLLWRQVVKGNYLRDAKLLYGDFRITCDVRQMLQRQLYFFGTYFLERNMIEVWRNFAEQLDIIFDLGANSGIYSLAAISVNPKASVFAFEPTPEIAERLRRIRQINNLHRLTIVEAAVSDRQGKSTLVRFDGGADNEGMNFVVQLTTNEPTHTVKTTTLDSFCSRSRVERIDLLKIDVQGLEPHVLRGARDLLESHKIGTVFLELNWSPNSQTGAADEAIELLSRYGFLFSEITRKPVWRDAGLWMREHDNIMAKHCSITPSNHD